MNALTKIENTALAAMSEQELMQVLQSSLYPGAKLESIKMVLGYCKAAGLDPMQKPVHIVPMKVSTGQKDDRGWDIKEDRDVIMPGVGLYRTQAARTGVYAGVSDPEFGPTKKLIFTSERWEEGENGRRQKRSFEESMDYPEWCRVSVTRVVDGVPREFAAREYWLENYATKGASSTEPNAMWKRRPFGQIAKCAEAQALRKAFPEMTGSQPTAEEMEGKQLDDVPERHMGHADVVHQAASSAAATGDQRTTYPADKFKANLPTWHEVIKSGRKTADQIIAMAETKHPLTDDQKAEIRKTSAPKAAGADQATDVQPKVTYAALAEKVKAAADRDAALLVLDEGRALPADQQNDLQKLCDEQFPQT